MLVPTAHSTVLPVILHFVRILRGHLVQLMTCRYFHKNVDSFFFLHEIFRTLSRYISTGLLSYRGFWSLWWQPISYHIFFLADESWFSFLQHSNWEILLMDAILDVPTDDGKHQTIRVTIPDNMTAPPSVDCRACKSQPTPMPPPPPPPEKWVHSKMFFGLNIAS